MRMINLINNTRFSADTLSNKNLEFGNIITNNFTKRIMTLNGMPVTPDAFQSDPPNGFYFYLDRCLIKFLVGILF